MTLRSSSKQRQDAAAEGGKNKDTVTPEKAQEIVAQHEKEQTELYIKEMNELGNKYNRHLGVMLKLNGDKIIAKVIPVKKTN